MKQPLSKRKKILIFISCLSMILSFVTTTMTRLRLHDEIKKRNEEFAKLLPTVTQSQKTLEELSNEMKQHIAQKINSGEYQNQSVQDIPIEYKNVPEGSIRCGDFAYRLTDSGEAAVTSFLPKRADNLVIPSELDGHKVVRLENKFCSDNYINSRTVEIPNTVKEIGSQAFEGCSTLNTITLPESITKIGEHAFYSCHSLKSVTLPTTVTHIAEAAFDDCWKLERITVAAGNSVYTVHDDMLIENGTVLHTYFGDDENVIVPNGIKRIAEYAFGGHSDDRLACLRFVTLPDGITEIGCNAFWKCKSLSQIVLPDSVTRICQSAFSDCKSLCEISFGSSPITIDAHAFDGCLSLRKIVLPENTTAVGDHAFFFCKSLRTAVIPSTLTSIPDGMFGACEQLTEFVIPNGVTSIGDGTFYGCKALRAIDLPAGLTSIGENAFSETGLTDLTIPDTVKSIGSNAFDESVVIRCSPKSMAAKWSKKNKRKFVTE